MAYVYATLLISQKHADWLNEVSKKGFSKSETVRASLDFVIEDEALFEKVQARTLKNRER